MSEDDAAGSERDGDAESSTRPTASLKLLLQQRPRLRGAFSRRPEGGHDVILEVNGGSSGFAPEHVEEDNGFVCELVMQKMGLE